MKKENNQDKNGSHRGEKDKIEEIPLWLQGLQEHEDEDTSPMEVEESSVENWVHEVHAATPGEVESAQEKALAPAEDITKDESSPDRLSELGEVAPEKPPVMDQQVNTPSANEIEEMKSSLIEGKDLQEREKKQIPAENIPEEVDESFEDLPSVESEIELQESDEAGHVFSEKSSTEDEMNQDELKEAQITEAVEDSGSQQPAQDEDLPPWLQEMIAEPQEIPPGQESPQEEEIQQEEEQEGTAVSADEPTEPIELSGESPPHKAPEGFETIKDEVLISPAAAGSSSLDKEELKGEEVTPDDEVEIMSSEEPTEPPPSEWVPEQVVEDGGSLIDEPLQSEMPASEIKGDTNPVETTDRAVENFSEDGTPLSEEVLEAPPATSPEAPGDDQIKPPASLPKELQKAKQLLSSGKMNQAVELILTLDERSKHTHEIGDWLKEASYSIEGPNVGFWELFGDTALENDQPDLAFNAYTKAIQSLLESQED